MGNLLWEIESLNIIWKELDNISWLICVFFEQINVKLIYFQK